MTGLFSRARLSRARRAPARTGRRGLRATVLAFSLVGLTGLIGQISLAPAAAAACAGRDLREALPAALQAEIATELARIPYSSGLSWTARRDGRRLDIIGTLHLNDPRHAPLVAHMAPAIQAADALLVEVNTTDKAALDDALGKRPELMFITEGPTLIDRLPEEDWRQIAALAQTAGIPAFMAAKMRPWFLSMSLSIPSCARQIPDVTNGLDMRLLQVAAEAGVPALSLEDPLTVFRSLDAAPLREQVEALRSYIALMRVGPDEFHTMLESYFDGEVQGFSLLQMKQLLAAETGLSATERQAEFDALMQLLLDDRNRAWIPVIEATRGDRLVIAVGAAHLPGKAGLLALLEAEGYTLEKAPL